MSRHITNNINFVFSPYGSDRYISESKITVRLNLLSTYTSPSWIETEETSKQPNKWACRGCGGLGWNCHYNTVKRIARREDYFFHLSILLIKGKAHSQAEVGRRIAQTEKTNKDDPRLSRYCKAFIIIRKIPIPDAQDSKVLPEKHKRHNS